MAFHVHTACRIEQFLDTFPRVFLPSDLMEEPRTLIFQNRNMGEWLKLELARRQGLSAGLNIRFPEQAVRQFMEHFDHPFQEHTLLFMDNLKVVVYRKIKELLRTDQAVYQPLRRYMQSGDDIRLYQLADAVGGLFYHYGMNCPELTASWEKDELYPGGSALEQEHQPWQMALWQEIFHSRSPYVHVSRILTHIIAEELAYRGPKTAICLFGSTFLGETGMRFFRYLARFLEVDFYYVIPSKVFEPFEAEAEPRKEWSNWSSLAGGMSSLLRTLDTRKAKKGERPSFPASLLGEIQESIWENRLCQPGLPDESLKVYSAPSPRRQVEVLKDRILELLDGNPDLQLNDICLMAPDINLFAPHLERVFTSERGERYLPCNFIDLKREGDASYTEGFLKLIELPGSRFTRSEIFSLLQNPCFAQKNHINEALYREWLEACESLNIHWGMDSAHRRAMGFPGGKINTWEWGIRRAILGMVYSSEEEHPSAPWSELPESEFAIMGQLAAVVRGLYRDACDLKKARLPLESWVLKVEGLMEVWLQPRREEEQDRLDRLAIKAAFRNLNNLIEGLQDREEREDRLFSWDYFYQLLQELISKTGRKKGHYLTQGISCSSLKPLRGIPFKLICLLGMDYGSFPTRENIWSFDLKDLSPRAIDLSRKASDQFAFLETLMSAREKLWIFYQGRDQVSGDPLLPSPLLTELMELASFSGQAEEILPLHGHHPAHFRRGSTLRSFDIHAWNRLQILGAPMAARGEEPLHLVPGEIPEMLDLDSLYRFLQNPLERYARERLGLYLQEDESLEEHQDESYQIPFLQESAFLRERIGQWQEGLPMDPRQWLETLRRRGVLSGSPWDRARENKTLESIGEFDRSLARILPRLKDAASMDIRLVPGLTQARKDRQQWEFPPLDLTLPSGKAIQLYGDIRGFMKEGRFLECQYIYGKDYKSKNGFRGFLDFLTLASTESSPSLDLILLGRENVFHEKNWNREQFSGEKSPRALLGHLAEAYLKGMEDPIPLYPDLVDRVSKLGKKAEYKENKALFYQQYRENWMKKDMHNPGPRCAYADLFYPEGSEPGAAAAGLLDALYSYCLKFPAEAL